MMIPGRSYTSKSQYRYGFNGKEKDNETYGQASEYNYGDRIYNPRLSRWLSIDALQQKHPNESPYEYVAGNPIIYKDPDGKDKIITTVKNYDLGNGNSISITTIKVVSGEYLKYKFYDVQKGAFKYNYYDQHQTVSEYYDLSGKNQGYGGNVTVTAGLAVTTDYDLDNFTDRQLYKIAKWWNNIKESHEGVRNGGGIMFTSEFGEGTDKGPKSTYIDATPENLDALVAAISQLKTTVDAEHRAENILEAIERTVAGGIETGGNVADLIKKMKTKIKDPNTTWCKTCQAPYKKDENGNPTWERSDNRPSDSTESHGVKPKPNPTVTNQKSKSE